MIRGTIAAGLIACLTAGGSIAAAWAEERLVHASEAELAGDGALDSASLDGVSGGGLMGDPTDEAAWRDAGAYSYPIDIPGSASPAAGGISDSARLGAEMGARPPGGDAMGGAGAVAGDVARTIF